MQKKECPERTCHEAPENDFECLAVCPLTNLLANTDQPQYLASFISNSLSKQSSLETPRMTCQMDSDHSEVVNDPNIGNVLGYKNMNYFSRSSHRCHSFAEINIPAYVLTKGTGCSPALTKLMPFLLEQDCFFLSTSLNPY